MPLFHWCRKHKCKKVKRPYNDIETFVDVTGPYHGETQYRDVTRYHWVCPECEAEPIRKKNAEWEAGRPAREAEAKRLKEARLAQKNRPCPKCGYSFSKTIPYCSKCGAYAGNPDVCSGCGQYMGNEKFCSKCGQKK